MQKIIKLISERQSSRGPYDPDRPISKDDLWLILEAARWTPTAHNMQNFEIVVVDDRKLLKAIEDIQSPPSPVFIRENYSQLSFSEEELKRKKTGIMGTMFPPEWRDPEKIEKAIAANELGSGGLRFQLSPLLLVVTYDPAKRAPASEGDFLGIISLGCLMENIWLAANSLGIGIHILSALSGDGMEKEVKRILNIPERLRIAFSARVGYPAKTFKYLRVRRDTEDFTHHNRFGQKGI
jgi:nitroreductase